VHYLAEGQETALQHDMREQNAVSKNKPPNNGNPPRFSNSFSSTMIRKVRRRETEGERERERETVKTRRSFI